MKVLSTYWRIWRINSWRLGPEKSNQIWIRKQNVLKVGKRIKIILLYFVVFYKNFSKMLCPYGHLLKLFENGCFLLRCLLYTRHTHDSGYRLKNLVQTLSVKTKKKKIGMQNNYFKNRRFTTDTWLWGRVSSLERTTERTNVQTINFIFPPF